MTLGSVFEVVMNAFFLAQPLQEGQVAFVVLYAKRATWILPMGQFETVTVDG